MINKIASILDYSFPFLDPAVWDQDMKLHAYQKDFILRLLNKMYETYELKQPELWVDDVVILGSLTTAKWLISSDMDVHVRVNLDAFIKTNMPGASKEEAFEKLDLIRKEFDRAKILAPASEHPIEFYMESVEFKPSNTESVGVYSIPKETWLKAPISFPADLDYEESKKSIVAQAEALAEELDSSFGKIKRDIQRVNELETVIKTWDKSKQQLFYKKIETKLNNIEEEIKKDLKIKQDLVDDRHANQDATSDTEIKFKWLQRFGLFGILQRLKELLETTGGEVTVEELPLIEKIISESSIKEAKRGSAAWIAPDGTVFYLDAVKVQTHLDWIDKEYKWLHKKYGFTIDPEFTDDLIQVSDALISEGWSRVGDMTSSAWSGIEVEDLNNVPQSVFDFINSGNLNTEGIIILEDLQKRSVEIPETELVNGQKAVNKALQQKRLSASKKEPQKLLIDFDHTLANENKDHSISEPINGAKEALDKLKQQGFEIEIYSVRANDEKGLDQVKEWLDKNNIPYDSIFQGEKPRGTIIDDHAIKFNNNWDEIVTQVEKSEKKANLVVTIPYGEEAGTKTTIFEDPTEEQANVLLENSKAKMLRWAIGNDGHLYMWDAYYMDHPMARASLGVDWSLQNSGYLGERIAPTNTLSKFWKTKNLVHASLNLPTIDPTTFNRKEPYALFIGTQRFGPDIALDLFDVHGEHPMITEHNRLPTVTLEKLQQENIPVIGKAPRAGDKQPAQDISSVYRQSKLFSKKEIFSEQKSDLVEYSCVMADVPKEVSQEVVEWGVRNIKDADLYTENNLGRELDSHITIKYGIISSDSKEVEKLFKDLKPFKATLGEVKHFEPKDRDFDVLTISVESKDLEEMNEKITNEVECATGLPSDKYHPHITIAYIKKGTCAELFGNKEFIGKKITMDSVEFSPVEGGKTTFELKASLNKFAIGNISLWLAPDGQEFPVKKSHHGWILENTDLLKNKYGVDVLVTEYSLQLLSRIEARLIAEGWVRVDGILPNELDLEVGDVNNIPQVAEQFVWKYKPEVVILEDLNGNDISFDKEEYSKGMMKKASVFKIGEFLPSLFNAPDNRWQFEKENGPDKEIALNPDPVSDETTWYAPCTEGKPRTKDTWRQFMSIFQKPISKKDTEKVSARDPELEEAEAKSMGEETLLEFSKGFYDPKKHDFPHNTTWDSPQKLPNQHEPYSPLPVTLDMVQNPENNDQNSPGGFPGRFCQKPKSIWFSNSGEVTENLIQMLKNKESAIDNMTRDITADLPPQQFIPEHLNAPTAIRMDNGNIYWSDEPHMLHVELIKKLGLPIEDIDTGGRIVDGIYHDSGPRSDTMRYVEQMLAKKRVEEKRKQRIGFSKKELNIIAITKRYALYIDGRLAIRTLTYSKALSIVKERFPKQFAEGKYEIKEEEYKISSLEKEADYTNAYWIDPNGKVFQVRGSTVTTEDMNKDFNSHSDWIAANIDMLVKDYGFKPVEKSTGLFNVPITVDDLIDAGWIRVGDAFGTDWGITLKDLNHIPSSVDSLLAQFAPEGAIIMVATPNNYGANYTFEWPVKSIQNTVNQIKNRREYYQKPVMAKQAGSYSSTYTDEQGNEFFNEQHQNDEDQIPYTNFDQRGIDFGMHDSPENTMSGVGWPQDNTPYVVRLDVLYPGPDRPFPFGMPDYETTLYPWTYMAGDGIEQMNP